MRRKVIVLATGFAILGTVLFGFSACASSPESREPYVIPQEIQDGFYSITDDEFKFMITRLASQEAGGRRNGTNGSYLAQFFIRVMLDEAFLNVPGTHVSTQRFNFNDVIRSSSNLPLEELLNRFGKAGFEVNTDGTNIIAMLEGTTKKDEFILIIAHYDHIGIQSGEWYPGADDNASGTAAVIEIAESFGTLARNGVRPERSIGFLLFDAEEWGLWGSQYFVENPPVPLSQIKAIINLDMIGRNDPKELNVFGSPDIYDFAKKNPQIADATMNANDVLGFDLQYPAKEGKKKQIFYRSDHASFFFASPEDNRIPVVFYTTGLHEDYHTPEDTADRINFEKAEGVARFAFLVAWQLATKDETPVFIGN